MLCLDKQKQPTVGSCLGLGNKKPAPSGWGWCLRHWAARAEPLSRILDPPGCQALCLEKMVGGADRRRHWATSGLAAQGMADPRDPFPHPPVVIWAFWVESLHSLLAWLLDHAVLLFRWLSWVWAFRVAWIIEIRGDVGIGAWLCILGVECGGCRFLMISCHVCTPLRLSFQGDACRSSEV